MVLVASQEVQATLTFVNSRGALGSTADTVDWSALGADFSTPSGPFAISSLSGHLVNVSFPTPGLAQRWTQGPGSTLYNGNFATGDALLWSGGAGGPLSIDFGSGVSAAGLQIQTDEYVPFTATLEAFGSGNILLNTFTFNGNSTTLGNNSAIFAGVQSTAQDIVRLRYSVTGTQFPEFFAVNQLSILPPIPEPATGLTGLACLFVIARSRFRAPRRRGVSNSTDRDAGEI